jgi:hypothetical protein
VWRAGEDARQRPVETVLVAHRSQHSEIFSYDTSNIKSFIDDDVSRVPVGVFVDAFFVSAASPGDARGQILGRTRRRDSSRGTRETSSSTTITEARRTSFSSAPAEGFERVAGRKGVR